MSLFSFNRTGSHLWRKVENGDGLFEFLRVEREEGDGRLVVHLLGAV